MKIGCLCEMIIIIIIMNKNIILIELYLYI